MGGGNRNKRKAVLTFCFVNGEGIGIICIHIVINHSLLFQFPITYTITTTMGSPYTTTHSAQSNLPHTFELGLVVSVQVGIVDRHTIS